MVGLVTQATDAFRAAGGRMTIQRRLIVETLETLGGHPTAEQVYQAARRRDVTLNPTTVYRTLTWLAEAGLVGSRHLEPHGDRCEHYEPALRAEHHHFICTQCGRVIEFAAPAIEKTKHELVRRHGVRIDAASLTLYGLCHACRIQGAVDEND
jgi:Fur family transcriptional regulator, ferric uptake regulator